MKTWELILEFFLLLYIFKILYNVLKRRRKKMDIFQLISLNVFRAVYKQGPENMLIM